MELDPDNAGFIDINDVAVPAILSGILGISVPMIYQGRQDGKLPANLKATYKECIQCYVEHYKGKVTKKSGDMYEAKLEQDVRNGIAKEQLQWLDIRRQKEELVDVGQLNELFQPVFHIVKANLVNLTRKFPETRVDIDRTLDSWFQLGLKIGQRAKRDSDEYIQNQLNKPIDLADAVDTALNQFGLEDA